MTARGETRQNAFQAACRLAARGERPSVRAIRQALNGSGGQQAIVDGLNDWIDEAARRFQVPGVPEEILSAMTGLWAAACAAGEQQWSEARGELEERLRGALDAADQAERERGRLAGELDEARAEHETAAAALSDVTDRAGAAEAALRERDQALALAQTELEAVRSERDRLAEGVAYQRRLTEEARASQQRVEADLAALRVDLEGRDGRIATLDASLKAAEQVAGELRTLHERTEATIADLHKRLSERDSAIERLSVTLQREQQARDDDTQHWLKRLDEVRTVADETKARESRLLGEKDQLVQDVRLLRKALSEARTEVKHLTLECARAQRRAERQDAEP